MTVSVSPATTRNEMLEFVRIPFSLYRESPFWVPPLIRDELETFDKSRNPAFETAEARFFIARKGQQPVGRIAAIISHAANQKYQTANLRFGWFESVEDYEVAAALFDAALSWGQERGMTTITGPLGFTDLDPEGMLVEGFDKLATIAGVYNFPYYPQFLERYGFTKEIDYLEFLTKVPLETGIPEKLLRLSERVRERGGLRVVEFRNKKELVARRGAELFHLLDEAFEEIYGAVPLNERQVQYYIRKYLTFVDKDLIKVVVNQKDEMVGFMIALPNLSRGFQKARGHLFPFGWWHILRDMRKSDVLDFYLAGIRKPYRGQGVDLLMTVSITQAALKRRFVAAESNHELETNTSVQAQWKYYNPTIIKRSRIFKRDIPPRP